jgi:hypothetical protein
MSIHQSKPLTPEKAESIRKATAEAYSVANALAILGLKPAGGNYKTFQKYKRLLDLDTSHFTGQAHLKDKTHTWASKTPDENLFIANYNGGVNTSLIRERLIKSGHFTHKCYRCLNTEWNGLPIPLELEHKNGVSNDNRLDNLTLLCPNCHAQTSTYRGKNKKA